MSDRHRPETGGEQPPARVMLVDDQPERAAAVEEQLRREGFTVLSVISSANGLLHQIEQHRPDVVLIDLQSPDRDVLESLAIVNRHNPTAMAMFSEQDDPEYIRAAVNAGISTYLMQGISAERAKPVIEVAMAQFRAWQELREELQSTRMELADRSAIDQAKALLIKKKQLSEDQAHSMLTRLAMNNNQRLPDVARTIVATLSDSDNRK